MKVLFLVEYSFKTGENEYTDHVLVSINAEKSDSFEKQQNVAIDSVMKWFPTFYPESTIIYVLAPKPTVKDHRTNPVDKGEVLGHVSYPMTEFPETYEGETESRLVVIDLDGKRKDFITGYYDHADKEWVFNGEGVDMDNARWMDILPIS